MQQLTIKIHNKVGLHARPASLFVQTANKFHADLHIQYGVKEANAKSILDVLSLGVKQDGEITITADGNDDRAALQALEALIQADFHEKE